MGQGFDDDDEYIITKPSWFVHRFDDNENIGKETILIVFVQRFDFFFSYWATGLEWYFQLEVLGINSPALCETTVPRPLNHENEKIAQNSFYTKQPRPQYQIILTENIRTTT